MMYGYYICPKCKNMLIKRIQENVECFARYGEKCEVCGERLRLAFTGEKEIDDTIYIIKPKNTLDKNIFKRIEKETIKILENRSSIPLEGDALHTYLNMELLDNLGITYDVEPKFSFARQIYVFCPDCGCETTYKTEETDIKGNETDSYMKVGFFCEKCNKWVAMTFRRKIDMDETKYKLEICLENPDSESALCIREMVDVLPDTSFFQNKVIIYDKACNIHKILEELKKLSIDYNIEPQYPYKIAVHRQKWTEEDLKILMEMNPGLEINLKQMNDISALQTIEELQSPIMIEKNAVFGELLYVGLVFEKGRYRSNGIWKYAYSKSLNKNLSLLREIAQCMQKEFKKEEDSIFMRKIYNEIKRDNILKAAYPFNKVIKDANMENFVITDCNNENKHIEIIIFIIKLLEDVLFELDRGLKKDKEKIGRLLFSLHNLPRVYLNKEAYTLCSLGQDGITEDNALEYTRMSMSNEMLSNYKSFLFF